MSDALLVTKVRRPMLRRTVVPRARVLRQLREGIEEGCLLTLVSAPAGYGKTTTIRMWAEAAPHPTAWVTLEKSDNDLKQFLTYFLLALQQAEPDLGQAALEVVENAQALDPQHVLGLLVADLDGLERPLILVLEEYQLIENTAIDQFIESLLNQAVANLHLVIATREDPALPLTRLRVRNQLTEIRAADLTFSLEEADQFFSQVMGLNLPQKEVELLASRTEGWAAGLQLAALSLKESADQAQFVTSFRGTHRHVLDYLLDEVLNSQPEAIRRFLRRTSILDQLSPALCAAVSGQPESQQYLRALESNNLFLVALDQQRTWYRYHALFAELLRNQLMQLEPECLDGLHERAADWYEENGFIERAVEHAFQVADGRKLSRLIEAHAMPLLYQGKVSTVEGWFDRLPDPLLHASPLLCISKAWSLALVQRHSRRVEEVAVALRAASAALKRIHADGTLRGSIAGQAATIQAFLVKSPDFSDEKPERLVEIGLNAQRLLPEDEKGIRSVTWLSIGEGYTVQAKLPEAEQAYQQLLADGVAGGNYYAAVYGPINLVLLALIKGELQRAWQLCETHIGRFNRLLAGQNFPAIGGLMILQGCILLEQNRLVEAEAALAQGLSLIRWTGEYRAHLQGYAALARLRAIQGDGSGMAESLKLLAATRPEGVLYAQALSHRLSLRGPLAGQTALEAAQRWLIQPAVRFSHLPDISGIDPISEARLRTYLSAAHVLARLAARKREAYPLAAAHTHAYLLRQETFAAKHGLSGWLIEIWLARALLYQVQGKTAEAWSTLQLALRAAAPEGYVRLFLDEGDLLRPLLAAAARHDPGSDLAPYIGRLLDALPGVPATPPPAAVDGERLSDRELEVLRLLAAGQSYREIGQQLFLSLNTVQFHVKNIYSKLAVNKRLQAIEKARKLNLL